MESFSLALSHTHTHTHTRTHAHLALTLSHRQVDMTAALLCSSLWTTTAPTSAKWHTAERQTHRKQGGRGGGRGERGTAGPAPASDMKKQRQEGRTRLKSNTVAVWYRRGGRKTQFLILRVREREIKEVRLCSGSHIADVPSSSGRHRC